jgi:hypothetical protein
MIPRHDPKAAIRGRLPRLTAQQWQFGLACTAAALLAGYLLWLDRPGTLSLGYASHASTPSVKQMQVNGQMMVRDSVTGRNETGGGGFAHGFTDRMDFRVLWYDFHQQRAWTAEFSVHGRELSTFGNAGDHASLRVQVGPGADVTVTTPNREQLRLIGLGRADELDGPDGRQLPEYLVPVVLRELCARPVPVDDPEIRFMIERAMLEKPTHIESAFADRAWSLETKGIPDQRCSVD